MQNVFASPFSFAGLTFSNSFLPNCLCQAFKSLVCTVLLGAVSKPPCQNSFCLFRSLCSTSWKIFQLWLFSCKSDPFIFASSLFFTNSDNK